MQYWNKNATKQPKLSKTPTAHQAGAPILGIIKQVFIGQKTIKSTFSFVCVQTHLHQHQHTPLKPAPQFKLCCSSSFQKMLLPKRSLKNSLSCKKEEKRNISNIVAHLFFKKMVYIQKILSSAKQLCVVFVLWVPGAAAATCLNTSSLVLCLSHHRTSAEEHSMERLTSILSATEEDTWMQDEEVSPGFLILICHRNA